VSSQESHGGGRRFSVVISTLGNYDVLARVLDGYSRQKGVSPGEFEVIVVSDAAEPDVAAVDRVIGERDYPVRRITGPEPGLSANRNAGWREARSPLVMFTDNDTIPVPRLVAEHLSWHDREPGDEVAVVGHVRWAREIDVTTFMRWLDRGIQFNFASLDAGEVAWGAFVGANVSLKRAFIERVGDFDQARFPYGYEDTDWGYRASQHGLRLFYNPRAIVDHLRPMTLEFWKKRARRVAAAEYTFTELHPELPPWFHRKFTEALELPRARGRAIRLAPYVPPWVPWLGPRVWYLVDVAYRQALAPEFLAAWDAAAAGGQASAAPDLSEFDSASSGGSSPGGPK
jgi:GT2 family glycosyltransferase